MKYPHIDLTDSDISAIVFGMSLLSKLDLYENDLQAEIDAQASLSVINKLSNNQHDFSGNEVKVMRVGILCMQSILKGNLVVDSETRANCFKYSFAVNKLIPFFESVFSK